MSQRIIEIFTANDHADAAIRTAALREMGWTVTETAASKLTVNENTSPNKAKSFLFKDVILLLGTRP